MTTGVRRAGPALKAAVATRGQVPRQRLEELAQQLRHRAEEVGLAALGIAPATPLEATRRILEDRKAAGLSGGMQFTYRNPARSTDPGRILPGAAALVVGAWPYARGSRAGAGEGREGAPSPGDQRMVGRVGVDDRRPKGLVARYARHDHYQDLRTALSRVADVLTAVGWRAKVVADDNALVDRAAAERAGIGWFGKNSNILLPGSGSWFLLGSVVTDAPLVPFAPVSDGCGSCRRCLGACPTGALVAPGVLDARKCLAWLLQATGVFPFEYRVALDGRIYGCDDCQEVCPANRLIARMAESDDVRGPSATDGQASVDLLELLSASDESLMSRYGRWYIPQRDPRYLRRNALVALGNLADGWLPEVGAILGGYLDHPDELLRAHAAWAAFRAGRQDLVASRPNLLDDPSPMVRDELVRQPEVPARQSCGGH
jgi:epoxyqueuosine reductase